MKTRITQGVTSNDPKSKRWRSLFASGRLAYGEGKLREAESLLTRALLLAADLPEAEFARSTTEIGLAAVVLAEKREVEAIKLLRKCIGELDGRSDYLHKELRAVALRFLGKALIDQGKESDGEVELKKSLEILKQLGPEAELQKAYTRCDLGGLYLVLGRHGEAGNYIIDGLKILSETVGTESAQYVRADMIYQACMPMSEATQIEIVGDAIDRMRYAYGHDHPSIERAVAKYLTVLNERGDTAKIEETKERFNVKARTK